MFWGAHAVENDVSYFRRRASQERAAALLARSPDARRKHLELAERYDDFIDAITICEQMLGVDAPDDR